MSHLHLNKKQEEEKERMKSEQGERRENGYPRTPEPEISKPLAGLPKPLAFGPPAMPGLSFPPNLGGLGKFFYDSQLSKVLGEKVEEPNDIIFLLTGGFPGPRPPGFSFLPPGPNQGMPGIQFFSNQGMPGILFCIRHARYPKKTEYARFFCPNQGMLHRYLFLPLPGLASYPTSNFYLHSLMNILRSHQTEDHWQGPHVSSVR